MYNLLLWFQLVVPTITNHPLPIKRELRDSTVNFIVLHYDDGDSYDVARRTLIRRGLSYHYYIRRDGRIVQMVDPKYKASHAGLSYFRGYIRLNNYSIGICLQNNSRQTYTEVQYNSLSYLVSQLQRRYMDSTSQVIIGHDEIAFPPGRKRDPGRLFNWTIFRNNLSLWNRTPYESLYRQVPQKSK